MSLGIQTAQWWLPLEQVSRTVLWMEATALCGLTRDSCNVHTPLLGTVHCLDLGGGESPSSAPSVHNNKNRADEKNHWDPSGTWCLLGWASFGDQRTLVEVGDQRTLVEVIHSEADRPISSIMEGGSKSSWGNGNISWSQEFGRHEGAGLFHFVA